MCQYGSKDRQICVDSFLRWTDWSRRIAFSWLCESSRRIGQGNSETLCSASNMLSYVVFVLRSHLQRTQTLFSFPYSRALVQGIMISDTTRWMKHVYPPGAVKKLVPRFYWSFGFSERIQSITFLCLHLCIRCFAFVFLFPFRYSPWHLWVSA